MKDAIQLILHFYSFVCTFLLRFIGRRTALLCFTTLTGLCMALAAATIDHGEALEGVIPLLKDRVPFLTLALVIDIIS